MRFLETFVFTLKQSVYTKLGEDCHGNSTCNSDKEQPREVTCCLSFILQKMLENQQSGTNKKKDNDRNVNGLMIQMHFGKD
jgi:hypothetical protein